MRDLNGFAVTIGERAAKAWWGAHGGNLIEIPLGVVAALALTGRANHGRPGPADQILRAKPGQIAELLHHIWCHFAIARPELCIRVGPFARWLDEEERSAAHLAGAAATAHAVAKAGLWELTAERPQAAELDLLGHVYQQLRAPQARKAHGETYTPTAIADLMARLTIADIPNGARIHEPAAGTGGLLRAAAQTLRQHGRDPHNYWWFAADIDPVAVAALAVNVHLWDLGRQVVITQANTLAEPNWETRALQEQNDAIKEHNLRVMTARLLVLDRLITHLKPAED